MSDWPKSSGICKVCGKSTKLLIHTPCGLAMDAAKAATKVFGKVTKKHQQTSEDRQARKGYKAGKVPWFCKL